MPLPIQILTVPNQNDIVIDSASTAHFTGNPPEFESEEIVTINPITITTLSGEIVSDRIIPMQINQNLRVNNVKVIDTIDFSVLSVGQLCNLGYEVVFTKQGCYIVAPNTINTSSFSNKIVLQARREGNLFIYNKDNQQLVKSKKVNSKDSSQSKTGRTKEQKESNSNNETPEDIIGFVNEFKMNADIATSASNSVLFPGPEHVLFDSAATSHFTGRKDLLESVKSVQPIEISTFTGETISTMTGKLRVSDNLQLHNVRYLSNAKYSLLSIPQACTKGYQVLFTQGGAYIVRPETFTPSQYMGKTILKAKRIDNLYVCELPNNSKKNHMLRNRFHNKPGTANKPGAANPINNRQFLVNEINDNDDDNNHQFHYDSDTEIHW